MRLDRSWGTDTSHTTGQGYDPRRRKKGALLGVVILGIALFVCGFIVMLSSLSEPGAAFQPGDTIETAGASDDGGTVILLVGLLVSLGGVVLATGGPLIMLMCLRASAHTDTTGRVE